MSLDKIQKTDLIKELAAFWDNHDITDYEGELEEVIDEVFSRESCKKGRI